MHIALSVQFGRDDQLIFAQQLGVEHVMVQADCYDEKTLESLRNRVQRTGLQLAGIEGVPLVRVEELQAIISTAEAVGINLISCTGSISGSPPQPRPTGRGNALIPTSAEPMSSLSAGETSKVIDTARDAGLRLAWTGSNSPAGMGMDLALDHLREDPTTTLAAFKAPVFIVRARNTKRGEPCFLDEGDCDLPRCISALKAHGFNGPLLAHYPLGMVGDTDWRHKARAYDLGYLKAVLQALGVH